MNKIIEKILGIYNKYTRVGKFLVAGGATAVVNLGLFITLSEVFNVWYLYASISSFVVSFFVNFTLQKTWTFKNREKEVHTQMGLFLATSMLNLALTAGLMYGLVDVLHVHHIISQILVIGGLAVMNYTIYRLVIFKETIPGQDDNES